MDDSEAEFVGRLCVLFDLGDPQNVTISAIPGNANRLWRLEVDGSNFVVKEFRYTIADKPWVIAISKAAEFEFEVWETSRLFMAEPIRGKDGAILQTIIGSRGALAVIRLHRWLDGTSVPKRVPIATAKAAGELLYDIHKLGGGFANSDQGTLRWWRWDPAGTLLRLQQLGLFDAKAAANGHAALSDAALLIAAGEVTPGRWIFSHYDHKPENTLSVSNGLAILDWDEAALCHPRLEVAESALHWAGIEAGDPSSAGFAGFIEGYRNRGGQIGDLRPSDFAKWAASIVGWFDYLGRRALQEFDDNTEEAEAAAQEAVAVIASLSIRMPEVQTWSSWGG